MTEKLWDRFSRSDGWVSALTGIGTVRDKRQSYGFATSMLDDWMLEELWRSNDMAARIIELPPEEMMRAGYRVCMGDDKDADEDIAQALEDLGVDEALQRVLCYQRALGGGALLLGVDDGYTDEDHMTRPLDETSIRSFEWVTPLSKREIIAHTYYDDPTERKFGEPKLYQLMSATAKSAGTLVHESRVLAFPGTRVSREQVQMQAGWGDSVLVRVHETLRDFQTTWDSAAVLLQDFAQAILKLEGLAELLASNPTEGKLTLKDRIEGMSLSMSAVRMLVLDKEEDYERKATPLTGMPEMLDKFTVRLAASAGFPVTVLFGQSPAGLNATGASDIRLWYDGLSSRQRKVMRPALMRLLRLLLSCKNGPTRGKLPPSWSLTFNPLYQLSDTEQAELRVKQSTVDLNEVNAGIVSPEEVAASRHGGDEWSWKTVVDWEERKKLGPPTPPAPKGGGPFA